MSRRSRSIPAASALLVSSVLLLPVPPAPAQEEPQEGPPEVFVDTVDVDLVNVEVVVTDRDGNPVHGLTRDDFVVKEDGEPVEVTNFYAVRGGRRLAPGAEPVPAEDVGASSPLPPDQRLNLVVLVDNLNISPSSRNRVLRELEARLDEILRPGDRVLVAVANPEVRVALPFTDDRAAVAAVLDRLELSTSRGDLLDAEMRMIRREIEEGRADILAGGDVGLTAGLQDSGESPIDQAREALDMVRSWSVDKHTQNLRLLATLNRFVEALSGLPGRRAVIYVSEGFPVRPAEALMEEWYRTFALLARRFGVASGETEATRWDSTSELVRLTRVAAGSQVTFYTLESGSAFHDGLDVEVSQDSSTSRLTDLSNEGGLSQLAWRTGGVPLLNNGSIESLLARMASDFREYYSLGYPSLHSNDGKYHRIEVEIPGTKLRVRHTQGYRATDPDQETAKRTLSALVFDTGENPLDVRVEVGDEQAEERDRYILPVLVRIPISSLALLPGESGYQGKVSVVVAIQDLQGHLSEPRRLEVPVTIPNDRLREAIGLQVAKGLNLLLREGESKLAVGVRDHLSGVTSTLNVSLSVGGG